MPNTAWVRLADLIVGSPYWWRFHSLVGQGLVLDSGQSGRPSVTAPAAGFLLPCGKDTVVLGCSGVLH